jgi:uncharacterized protein involved in exopolysaccharide biosynthesis
MNLRRGSIRLGIVVAVFALPLLGGVAYEHWREQQQSQRLQQIGADAVSSKVLYEMFVQRAQQTAHEKGLAVPDARIISRSAIPTSSVWWSFPWRVAVFFGAAGFVLGAGASWIVSGFRGK